MKLLMLAALAWVAAIPGAGGETAAFVAGRPTYWPNDTNSFVVTLSNPQDIEYARVLVATRGIHKDFDGGGDAYPALVVDVGADGTNRNVLFSGEPAWSWHVVRIRSWFGALADPPYNHPWQLEQAVRAGAVTNGTTVSFGEFYTFLEELDPPLRVYEHVSIYGSLILYWTHNQPRASYDIEYSFSLNPPDWKATGLASGQTAQVGPWSASRWAGENVLSLDFNLPGNGCFFRLRMSP